VRLCNSCQCPAPAERDLCAFCGAELVRGEPVAFSLTRVGYGYEWQTDGALVARASIVNGLWQLHDARGAHVVTLVPLADTDGDGGSLALVGQGAHIIGSIRAGADVVGGGTVASDPDGRAILVLRTDGDQAAHLVDRSGDVVAIASWDDPDSATDLLVTALGTRHSLAMVFGLLLSLEVSRHADRII
jgi:hypothetical protein